MAEDMQQEKDGAQEERATATPEAQEESLTPSEVFDKYLRENPDMQSEFDRRSKKAQDTREANVKAEITRQIKAELENRDRLAKMSEKEKYEDQLKNLREENQALQMRQNRADLARQASKILKERGIDATDAMLSFVVDREADVDKTKANIDAFAEIISSQIKLNDVKRATGKTPKDFNQGAQKEIDPFEQELLDFKKQRERK